MSDKSIVRGGNLVGDGCSVFEHSALDQSLFYPSDMSALPTSTPNPANLRRKSRRSWFETTPKGFKFEIAVEKPAVKAPVRKSDTVEVLTLTHFSGAPRLGFGTLKVGHEKTCTLLLRNPHDYQQSVKVEKFPEKKHFSISCKEFIVGPEESYPLDITWSPKEAGGCREMVMMQVDGAYRVQAYVFGTVTAPPPQKKKTKRVGLLASKATRPLSVIHTKSLANINQQYSPEKKTGKQSTKQAVGQKLPNQMTSKTVKPWAQPKGQAQKSKAQTLSDGISKRDRRSGEPKRKSPRLSDKYKQVCEENIVNGRNFVEDIENTDPDSLTRKERRSSGRKTSLPKPKIEEKLSRKKMRRSNTYSQVSGLGLVVPIIHGETVKGLQDTSLLNIEDCNISGVQVLDDSVRKIDNNCLEPSFLEPGNNACTRPLKENAPNILEPSFLSQSKDNIEIEDTVFVKEEAKTLLKSKLNVDTLEPSFLEEYKTTYVAKNTAFNGVKNNETFHDSLDVENQSVEEPSFLQNENVKPDRPRRSLRKRSGIIEVENDNKPTGVKLLRGAKRNNARKIITSDTFAQEVSYKDDGSCEKLTDKHKHLDDSVGKNSLLDQLKSLKSYVHDKSLEIEKSGNESFVGMEDKCSAEDLPRRETFVKSRTSPRFSMPAADANIRRGTFVAESTKLKILETQKPSEASPRRTTFTVPKEFSNSRKLLQEKDKHEANALNEEEEPETEVDQMKNNNQKEVNDQMEGNGGGQKQLERLYSADSLEDDSFEKQTNSPDKIFVEGKVEWARRATLTVTKSRPSDALLEHAKRSAAAVKKLADESAMKHSEQTISEELAGTGNLTEVREEISPPKSSQNSTFEVPLENSVLVAKDSSFPTTPYHLLPTSPQLNHSRRSTHIVEKPKVVNLSRIDGKQLFSKEVNNEVGNDRDDNEAPGSLDNQNSDNAVQVNHKDKENSEISPEITEHTDGPSSNLRRRKLSARRSVASLGRKSVESLDTSLTLNEGDNIRNNINETESGNKDTTDSRMPEAQQAESVDQLFFVPFNKKDDVDQPTKPQTKKPDPKQFLKKRSNPVTQEEDRLSSKRPKSENAAPVTSRKNSLDDDYRNKGKQTTKVKDTVEPPARVTRQRVKSVGAAKITNSRQGVKPSVGMVKGLATSKLILTKKSKTAIPKHPLPFAAKNMFYDERWMEKQERGFVNWLNFILTPPEEHQGSDVKVKVDAGKLTLDIEKGRTRLAPTNEILSFRTYSAHRKLNRLRKSACRLFQSESVRRVIQKVEEEVENKRLLVRKDKMIHADVGAKQKVLDMLLSYNPLWLRVGLETIYGEVVPIQCNTDVYGLSQFIVLRVLGSPDIAEEFAHPTVPHLYRDGYAEATAQHTLKRYLMLVYFLDQAKQHTLIDHNPCLFCKNSDIKASKDMLLLFSRDFLSGEGDITRHLGYLGYKVTYSQTALDEFDFAVKSLGTDLRDGLRLARVMEVICDKTEQIRKSLRTPAISRLQKIHNLEVVFKVLEQQRIDTGVVTTRDIVDGHREKTLSLLWTIILHYQVAMVINVEQVKEEVQILERSLRLKKQLHKFVNLQTDVTSKRRESEGPDLHTQDERLNLLMKWCRAVCAFYDIKIENFTVSFSDGRALCHILHYYHPRLLPLSEIHNETSVTYMEDMEKNCRSNMNCSLNDSVNSSAVFGDTVDPAVYEKLLANEKENFKKLSEKVKELGGIPLMLRWSDMSNTIPDEKVVVTYLMYLCARLLDIRHESRAARVIQHAWRAHRLRKIQALYEVKSKAIVVIQRAVKQFLQRRREEHRQSAALTLQRVWRGHRARSEARKLRREILLQKHMHAVSIVQNAVKRYLHRRRYLVMKAAVVQVQAYCRGYLYRRTRQTAATNIQRVFRGHLARQQVSKMHCAAVKIQACIRSFLARKLLHKQTAAASIIQCRYRACLAMRKQHCIYSSTKKACVVIQKWWRRHLTLKHERLVRASVTIQACVRRWLAKKHYQKLRENAVCIQAAFRGSMQRRKFEKCKSAVLLIQRRFRTYLKTRKQRQTFLELRQAAIAMQSRRRMLVQRRKYLLIISSAIRLQACARMLIQRQKFQRMKSSVVTLQRFYRAHLLVVECRREYLITVGATITLQAGVRGMICRMQYKKARQQVVSAQAFVRGHLQYKKYQNLRQATILLQRRYRQAVVARQQRSDFMKMRQAVIVLQSKWRMNKERKNYSRLKSSVVLIQSAVRKMIQQNRYNKIKTAVKTIEKYYHARVEGDICRRQFLVSKGAVMTLQAAFRGHKVRKEMNVWKVSAIKIQASVRGYIQRQQYKKLKESAIFIQRRFREILVARQQRSNFIQMKQSAVVLQSIWRMNKERSCYLKMKRSATLIQSSVRKMIQQNRYKKIKSAVKTIEKYYHAKVEGEICRRQFLINKGAAMTLQAAFRGHKVRKAMKVRCISATKIQAVFRGHVQRKQFQKLRLSTITIQRRFRETLVARQQRSDFIQIKQAAVVLQSTWRMYKGRNCYLKMRRSVVLIQSTVRKMIQQNQYKKIKYAVKTIEKYYHAKVEGEICRRQFLVCKGAAMTLQAAFKGHKVRKAMKVRCISAAKIQTAFRGHVQRKHFQKLRQSAITIQRRFRETLVARQQRSDFIQMKQAAVVLQSAWRMKVERNSYLKIKRSVVLIQSAVRKMIQQNKYNKLKSAVKTIEKYYHAKVEGDICRRQFLVCKGAAMTLQAAFRGHKVRKTMKERNASAVKIQAIYRGFAQCKQFQELKKATLFCQRKYRLRQLTRKVHGQYLKSKNAAITIQAAFKGYVQRQRYRKTCSRVVKLQSVVRRYLQQQRYRKMNAAVVVIQKRIRETLLSRKQRSSFLKLKHAAVVVQSMVRMKQERSRFAMYKAAAILIQSRIRGYIQQKKYKRMIAASIVIQKYYRAHTEAQLCRRQFLIAKGAAITIQAYFRGYQVRMEKKLELKSAIVIQSVFRGYCQRKQYIDLKNAATVFQKHYRAVCMKRKIQEEYQSSRKAIIQLQAAVKTWSYRRKFLKMKTSIIKIQATYRMYTARKRYQIQRKAAVTVQNWFRGVMLTNAARRNFLLQKGAVITIQAYAKMYIMRKLYLETMASRKNTAAVRIQTCFRRHIAVQRFQSLKSAVITCQSKYRAKCCGQRERQSYLKLKESSIKIQSGFRALKCQRKYHQLKSASVTIQCAVRVWRAKKVLQNLKNERRRLNAAVTLQSGFRSLQARRQLTALREEKLQHRQMYLTRVTEVMRANMAAMVIQRCYRNYKIIKVAKERLHSILLIQRWMRNKLQRLHYLRERKFVIRVQSHIRTWLARRDRAARVIQRAARHWLGDAVTRKQNRAAVKIQSLWRGYYKRKTIKSRRLTLLRKRVQETAASVTEEKKLGNRTSSALDFLLRYKLLSQVMDALQHLDVASRLSWICCERMVEAIPVLYRLVESCNRSLPHMDIIKCTISILTNLAKYEKTRGAVYEAEKGVDILMNLMQIYREKPPVFNKICTLLGILALDTPCKTSILADKKLVEKLTSIQSLTARKHKLEENQRVTRARMNASSLNATFLISAPVKKHKINPDWALHKDKMNDIENPLKAINFVLGNLGIKPNAR